MFPRIEVHVQTEVTKLLHNKILVFFRSTTILRSPSSTSSTWTSVTVVMILEVVVPGAKASTDWRSMHWTPLMQYHRTTSLQEWHLFNIRVNQKCFARTLVIMQKHDCNHEVQVQCSTSNQRFVVTFQMHPVQCCILYSAQDKERPFKERLII